MTNKNPNKTLKILKRMLETIWLIVALIALGIAIKELLTVGFKNSILYFVFSLVAFFFFFSRRKQRVTE